MKMKKIISVLLVLSLLFVGLVIAQAEGLLTEAQQIFFNNKQETVTIMVEEGRLTPERAQTFLTNLEQKLSDGTCDQTGEDCDGTCEPQLNGKGNSEGIQVHAFRDESQGQNGNGACAYNSEGLQVANGAQNGYNGEGQGPHGDGACDLGTDAQGTHSNGGLNGHGNGARGK